MSCIMCHVYLSWSRELMTRYILHVEHMLGVDVCGYTVGVPWCTLC